MVETTAASGEPSMAIPNSRIGLALGSGVARGLAHIGVLRALEREGIRPAIVAGTSIGALIGGVYLGGRLDEFEAWARSLNRLSLSRLFDFQFGRGGLIAGRRIAAAFGPELRDLTIEALPARFVCVATELGTGHEVWLQQGNLLEAIRASYALPGLFAPARIDGRWLLDGALVNPVPVSVCRALGARAVIAVNLSADSFGQVPLVESEAEIGLNGGLEADPAKPHGGGRLARGAALAKQLLGRAGDGGSDGEPSLFSVMASSLNIVQDRLTRSRLAGDPPDAQIAPKLGHIGLMEFDRAEESIGLGEQAVEAALPAIRDALRRLNGR
jgi:NTE family protein